MKRNPLVAGNWKMHGSRAANAQLIAAFCAQPLAEGVETIVCPPFVYLGELARQLLDTPVALGAQDLCAEAQGAFTGEVSGAMLRDVGCTAVIVGHSERRGLYGETDELVARKFVAAISQDLTPILCVGEQLEEREAGETMGVIARQLDAVVKVAGIEGFQDAVVAYEPVWAIGTGRTASAAQAEEVHAFIRGRISALDAKIAAGLRILYGGSVKAANAAEIFAQPDIDGGLIGGASLKAEEFLAIVVAATGKQSLG